MNVRQWLRAGRSLSRDPTYVLVYVCVAASVIAAQVLGRQGRPALAGWLGLAGRGRPDADRGLRRAARVVDHHAGTVLPVLDRHPVRAHGGDHRPVPFVRHPSYTGLALGVIGYALACGDVWSLIAAAALAGLGLTVRIRVEERQLRESLGADYDACPPPPANASSPASSNPPYLARHPTRAEPRILPPGGGAQAPGWMKTLGLALPALAVVRPVSRADLPGRLRRRKSMPLDPSRPACWSGRRDDGDGMGQASHPRARRAPSCVSEACHRDLSAGSSVALGSTSDQKDANGYLPWPPPGRSVSTRQAPSARTPPAPGVTTAS